MSAENLPVNPMQPKMEVVILPDHVLEMMPQVLRGVSIPQLCREFDMSKQGMKRRLWRIYTAFGVRSQLQLLQKAATDGVQYAGASTKTMVFFAETTIREKRL